MNVWMKSYVSSLIIGDFKPDMSINSANELCLFIPVRDASGLYSRIRLMKMSETDGSLLADTTYSNTEGKKFILSRRDDFFDFAYISYPDQQIIFLGINLLTLNFNHYFNSTIQEFDNINKFSTDSTSSRYYVKSITEKESRKNY